MNGWLPGNASIGADFFCQIDQGRIVRYLLFSLKERALNGVESCGRGVAGTCGRLQGRLGRRNVGSRQDNRGGKRGDGVESAEWCAALNVTEWCRTGLDCAEYGGMVRSGAVDESEFKGDAE